MPKSKNKRKKVKASRVHKDDQNDKIVALYKFVKSFDEEVHIKHAMNLAAAYIATNCEQKAHESQKHTLEMDNKDIVAVINQKQNNLTDSLIERKSQFLEAIKKHDDGIKEADKILSEFKNRVNEIEESKEKLEKLIKYYKAQEVPGNFIVALYKYKMCQEEVLQIFNQAMNVVSRAN